MKVSYFILMKYDKSHANDCRLVIYIDEIVWKLLAQFRLNKNKRFILGDSDELSLTLP